MKAINPGAFVWADSTSANFSSTAANQFLVRAGGGVGIGTNAPSEALNVAGNVYASGSFIARSTTTYGDGSIFRRFYLGRHS